MCIFSLCICFFKRKKEWIPSSISILYSIIFIGFHPHLCNDKQLEMISVKSHLVLRMIQLKIGHDLLLQVNMCVCTLLEYKYMLLIMYMYILTFTVMYIVCVGI